MEIGKMKEVDIRSLWKHEQFNFSNWLAEPDNIDNLNKILGLSLTDVVKEEYVGAFHCDLFARDESTGIKVIIENQLEPSNHDHLGKIITYASGLDANVVVWIVKRAREEHISAIEWLNNNTNSDVNFFLIELHAYSIDNSKPAPLFQVIEKPNGFIKYSKKDNGSGNMSRAQVERLEFWNQFNEILINRGQPFNKRSASTDAWYDVAIGSSFAHIAIELINKDGYIRIGLYITNGYDYYDRLYDNKDEIESQLGLKLEWDKECRGNVSRVKYNLQGLNYDDHSNYNDLINKSIDIAAKMKKVFRKYL